jgi:hypothetical protein
VATTENRGGMRPTAGQNNPYKISPNGGNGQSGKKAAKAMQLRPSGGGASGATKALTQQMSGAPGVITTATATQGGVRPLRIPASELAPTVGIADPSLRGEEDITTGSLANPIGMMTPGPEALTLPGGGQGDAKFQSNIDSYYSVLSYIQGRDDTSEDTRQIINALMRAAPSVEAI